MNKKDFGYKGEDAATQFLQNKGYEIIERNFTIWGGEIDIIAKKKDFLVFVEVKTRRNESWQKIEESITDKKIKFITNAAEEWFFQKKYPETFWQIDFIGIIMGTESNIEKIVHLQDI